MHGTIHKTLSKSKAKNGPYCVVVPFLGQHFDTWTTVKRLNTTICIMNGIYCLVENFRMYVLPMTSQYEHRICVFCH